MLQSKPAVQISFALFALMHVFTCTSKAPENQKNINTGSQIKVSVDPRIELFSTIHRLAGTAQYDENNLPEYVADVETYFDPYRDHEAVKMAIRLRETYTLDGNSPMALAVYLTDPPECKARASLIPPPKDLDPRWTSNTIPVFLEVVRKFAIESDFNTFFKAHLPLYERAVQNLQSTLDGEDLLPWFQEYFGYQPDDFVIILGLQNGSCNYGSSVTLEDGRREFQCILGASRPDSIGAPQYPGSWYIPTIIHEFCHSYVNPLVDQNLEILQKAGEQIFPSHQEELSKSGYNYWHVMMYEYLTRACVVRFLYSKKDSKAARNQMEIDAQYGFPAIKGLVKLLEGYENQRDIYPNMDKFMMVIAEYFEDYALSVM